MKRPTIKWNRKYLKHGSYSLAWTAAIIAIIIVVNLIAGELPSRLTSFDMTQNQYYSLTDQSVELLRNLTEDVTIYELTQDGTGDAMTENLLEQYTGYSGHIRVEQQDIVQNPNFASNYTDQTLEAGSLIVVCGDVSRVISASDLYEYSYNSYYQATQSGFDGEGQITSAIAYVTSDDIPKLYVLEGHGEWELSSDLTDQIEKENIEVESLSLLSQSAVPEDAAAIMINSPSTDLSAEEAQMILTYLQNGGKAFITSTYTEEDMPNFRSILEYYGVSTRTGVVVEGDSSYYYPQSALYLLPEIESTNLTTSLTGGNRYVIMPISQGIDTLDSARDTLNITSLLTTTSSSYEKADAANMTTLEQEDGDAQGPFSIGVYITETLNEEETETETDEETEAAESTEQAEESAAETETETAVSEETAEQETSSASEDGETAEETAAETKIAYFSSGYIMDEQMDAAVSGGNYELVMNCISDLVDHESSVSIPVKSLEVTYLTLPAASVNWWSIMLVAVVPIAVAAVGGVIWYRRRKR